MMMMMRVAAGFLLLLPLLAAAAASGGPVRMQLRHADAGRGLTAHEQLQRMARRSMSRAAARFLSGGPSASVPVAPGQHGGDGSAPWTEYLVYMAIGTPPQAVQLVLDTGSDLVWTQCLPCTSSSCFPQDLPFFDPSLSSTLVNLNCDSAACQDPQLPSSCVTQQTCVYGFRYIDGSATSGQLVADTFVFQLQQGGETAVSVPSLSFGCGSNNVAVFASNQTGIAGFGRGALSLPSQLLADSFSYCFTSVTGSTPSTVLLGPPPNVVGSGGAAVQTTPFVQGPSSSPSFYYLNLTSITVGSTTLQVPASTFALNADGTGGTVIDSGTAITTLPRPVFSLLGDAFASETSTAPVAVPSLPGYICFPASTAVPALQLQFDGGATLDLPPENYVFPTTLPDESGQSSTCIAIASSGGSTTIIGNYQQQNMYVIYDLVGDALSFVPAQCDQF